VEVRFQDGALMERLVIDARGDPGRALSPPDVLAKYAHLSGTAEIEAETCLHATDDDGALRSLCQALDRLC
jgi:hypothetical protein